MLVNSKSILLKAMEGKYAVGAFNVENMEMAIAVVRAAEELNSPVILQTTPSTVKYSSLEVYYAMFAALAKKAKVEVAIHLDHGNSYELCTKAFRVGYTSIMIDGSHESFEDNIALTKKVVDMCKGSNVSVEAELGKVGGKEDDLEVEEGNPYTIPSEAKEFVERTNCDLLAIGVGTSHGIYAGEINVSVETVREIRKLVSVPLVLHGTSGVPDEVVKECIENGITKVNYATDLRIHFTNGVLDYMKQDPEVFDPKKYSTKGMEYVTNYVKEKILVCGSNK